MSTQNFWLVTDFTLKNEPEKFFVKIDIHKNVGYRTPNVHHQMKKLKLTQIKALFPAYYFYDLNRTSVYHVQC